MSRVIGIDLGTTYSAVAYLKDDGTPEVIPDRRGNRTLPSVVTILEDAVLAGESARGAELTHPETTLRRVKRKMGTDHQYSAFGRAYSPEEISSYIIKKLRDRAEDFLGETVRDAVITVPAYFNDNQRQATKNAGSLAGLNVLRILNEPTAASLAYGIQSGDGEGADRSVVVYDLGGGTFDVSVLSVGDGVFEVLSTAGDNSLGGEDFNRRIAGIVTQKFKEETGIDLNADPLAVVKLSQAVEQAKIELSQRKSARVRIPFITADARGPKSLDFELTRAEFERMIADYIARSTELCRLALSDAGMDAKQVDRIVLVGGSTRIPAIRDSVRKLFGKEPETGIDPDEVVARGAAIQGAVIQGGLDGIVLVDVTPMSLGIEVENGYFVPIIERNCPVPTVARRVFTTVCDRQKSVDVHILQGESLKSANNVSLGNFRLEGVRSAPKGEPRIEVTFELDVDGILSVRARDADTQSVQSVSISQRGRLSETELERLRDEHLRSFEDDLKKRGALNTVLLLKTKADAILSKIDRVIPPAYQAGFLKDELEEIAGRVNRAVRDLDASEMESVILRLDFIRGELTAGFRRNRETAA